MLALAAALPTCGGLLGGVLYCDTSYQAVFGANRCTLFGLFVSTFYNDVRSLWAGVMSGAPATSLAGEVTATEWTQCLFVPFIVAWMVWGLWPRLRRMPVRGDGRGFAILGAGLALYLLGFLAENYYIGVVSMELVYAGLIVLFLGWNLLRALAFPCLFLLFMWPYGFFEDVAFQLRMLMAALSHDALIGIGVPNVLNGSAILSPPNHHPPFAIDIADPCSGIRSLFALVMIAALAAFFMFRRPWQMIVLVAASAPLVIFGNLVRILALTLATIHFGQDFALGANDHPSWFHEGAGYAVYVINFATLLGLGRLLARLSPDAAAPSPGRSPAGMTPRRAAPPAFPMRTSLLVLALGLATIAACRLIPPSREGEDQGVVMDLPTSIGALEGVPAAVSRAELEILPPDTTFARKTYAPFIVADNDPINRILCSIVLSGREKRSIHRPERCLPGQGWSVMGTQIVTVPLASGPPIKATALLLRRPLNAGPNRYLYAYYLYWYVGRSVSTPYSFVRVLLTNWDLVVHRSNQRWAYVIVMKPITAGFEPGGLDEARTLAELKEFIRRAAPTFIKSEMPKDGATADAS